MSRSKEAWADDPFDTWNADAPLQEERNDIADLGTDYRDLPPEPGDGDPTCPFCQSTSGFEAIGFGEGGPERCKACGHMSHESER